MFIVFLIVLFNACVLFSVACSLLCIASHWCSLNFIVFYCLSLFSIAFHCLHSCMALHVFFHHVHCLLLRFIVSHWFPITLHLLSCFFLYCCVFYSFLLFHLPFQCLLSLILIACFHCVWWFVILSHCYFIFVHSVLIAIICFPSLLHCFAFLIVLICYFIVVFHVSLLLYFLLDCFINAC